MLGSITPNVIWLGEVAFVRWLVCRKAILPNCCYLLVRFITTELELERKRFFFSFLCDGKY
jgi:hypothetical protein